MNRSGAVAITDTIPPTVATQLARDRATAGQGTTTVAPGGPSAPRGAGCPASSCLRRNHEAGAHDPACPPERNPS